MVKVMTKYICPPIPVRCADWAAWIDGMEETPHLNGIGATEVEALQDLLFMADGEDVADAVQAAIDEASAK